MIRIPLVTIRGIMRGKAMVIPEIGKPFDFTEDEVKELSGVMPDALRTPNSDEEIETVKEFSKNSKAEAKRLAEEEAKRLADEAAALAALEAAGNGL